ncbi:RIP metalloprotease RseP [Rhodoferax sp.]|uniref:RIP metalloprotease RseP n=1 Tax=Rhodoferax sp. TaxID=50421 RepID=UPI0025D74FD0|nr:RIP metalloprotease RseP [Rhodoferax sp.]
MQTVLAFLVAIGLLVAVHEWGHYIVARLCGVKVLRFSIGFGPRLWGRTSKTTGTEFVISLVPLGGYVKMLDGREGTVRPEESHLAFDQQPLHRRSAIVAAGPLVNLLFAVLLYSVVNWQSTTAAVAVLPSPVLGSMASSNGWTGGERIVKAGYTEASLEPVQTFEEFRWWLTTAALKQKVLLLEVIDDEAGGRTLVRSLDFSREVTHAVDATLFQRIGWLSPFSKAEIGEVSAGSRAASAGLLPGDLVTDVDSIPVKDAYALRAAIRMSAERPMNWQLKRGSRDIQLTVTPAAESKNGVVLGRIGAYVGGVPEMVSVRYGLLEGFKRALVKTWDIARMSLVTMAQMVTGEVSLKNLNGPIAIADYAGKSAALGLIQFVSFLALISISLGVLNLLPLPVLDGGHLMYYLWEAVTGRPVPARWWEHMQRVGITLLLAMMVIAFYNDIQQILG